MEIRAVIWDVGGVLLRTEDPVPRQALADRLGIERLELEKVVFSGDSSNQAQLGKITIEEHWEQVRRILGLEIHEMDEFRAQFWSGDRVDYELVETIRSLQKSRCKTGILSNAFSNLREFLRDECGIVDAFDELVISAEEGVMKPDQRIYQLALARLGVEGSQAVFIDDVPANVEGARRVGMDGIHFRTSQQVRQELKMLLDGRQP
jgi:epoxide hydrolase-like predicted phosphatase